MASSSSSSSDDDDNQGGIIARRRAKTFRPRINFRLNGYDFKQAFRLTPRRAQLVLNSIAADIQHATAKNMALEPSKQLLLALHFFATGTVYHTLADAHGPKKATVCRVIQRVVSAINRRLFAEVIRWPDDRAEMRVIARQFFEIAELPSIFGCIDGTHINIKTPSDAEDQYVDRFQNHSLNCMMVCGPNYKFFYVSARWPGSVHDARVLRTSPLAARLTGGWRPIPDGYLLGDSGYPLRQWLITPLRRVVTNAEQRFNQAHKRTRSIVERSFGVLKERFRCVGGSGLRVAPVYAGNIIKVCTVLHNFCIDDDPPNEDDLNEDENGNDDDDNEDNDTDNDGVLRRRELIRLFN